MLRPANRATWAVCVLAVLCADAGAARADLRFDAVSVHLGEVRSSVPTASAFGFVNAGPEAVELVEARVSCGCLRPRLDKLHFAPGERGSIALQVQTLGQAAGPHTWTLTVVSKMGETLHEQRLEVTATIITEVSVQPAALTLVAAGPVEHTLTLTDLRPQPLTLTAVETTAPWLSAEAGPLARDGLGNCTSKIRVQVAASCPVGRHDESIILHTSDAQYAALKVAVTVVKRTAATCTATPAEVHLSSTAQAQLVRVGHAGSEAVSVEGAIADNPAVTCRWAAGPANQATIKLQIDPAHWDGKPLATQVRVQIASPTREVLVIPVWLAE